MDTNTIKGILVKSIGGKLNDWKRTEKFSFANHNEFFVKESNNTNLNDLAWADYAHGAVPNSGVCRVFVAYLDVGDTTAHVITSDNDESVVYITVSSD